MVMKNARGAPNRSASRSYPPHPVALSSWPFAMALVAFTAATAGCGIFVTLSKSLHFGTSTRNADHGRDNTSRGPVGLVSSRRMHIERRQPSQGGHLQPDQTT